MNLWCFPGPLRSLAVFIATGGTYFSLSALSANSINRVIALTKGYRGSRVRITFLVAHFNFVTFTSIFTSVVPNGPQNAGVRDTKTEN